VLKFKVLKAGHGDCILLSLDIEGVNKNILIDGGVSATFRSQNSKGPLLKELERISSLGERVDLLILTHIDDDHIGGLIKGFKDNGILTQLTDKVWFNAANSIAEHFGFDKNYNKSVSAEQFQLEETNNNTSVRQGVTFERYVTSLKIWDKSLIKAGNSYSFFGLKFTILSPNDLTLQKLFNKWEREESSNFTSSKESDYRENLRDLLGDDIFDEDKSIANGSSIAFLVEYSDKNILFLGDAHSSVIEQELEKLGFTEANPLNVEYVKLSHHGSKFNTSPRLLSILNCNNFIISSNTKIFNLPNKKTIARLLNNKSELKIYFNYPEIIKEKIFSEPEIKLLEQMGAKCLACEEPFKIK